MHVKIIGVRYLQCVLTGKIHFVYALVCSRAITCLSWQSLSKAKQNFYYSVSQKKKKKKSKKKKLGKETNGTWLRRGILLALNAQWNFCSKKVFTQPEKVVPVIAQACAMKAVDLFQSTAPEFRIYVFIKRLFTLTCLLQKNFVKENNKSFTAIKFQTKCKNLFLKKMLKRRSIVYTTRITMSYCPSAIQFCIWDEN